MTREEQKAEEREVLELLCQLDGTIALTEFVDGERPDFVTSDGRLGIEVVEYRQDAHVADGGSNHRRREEVVDGLLSEGLSWFTKEAPEKRLDVYLHPRRGEWPPRQRTDLRKVGAALGRALLDGAERGEKMLDVEHLPLEVGAFVSEVWFNPPPAYCPERACQWTRVEATWLDAILPAVEQCIREKEGLVPTYRRAAREVWLVMHSSRVPVVGSETKTRASSTGRASPELLRHVFRTAFDKVLFLDREGPRLSVLLTEGNVAPTPR